MIKDFAEGFKVKTFPIDEGDYCWMRATTRVWRIKETTVVSFDFPASFLDYLKRALKLPYKTRKRYFETVVWLPSFHGPAYSNHMHIPVHELAWDPRSPDLPLSPEFRSLMLVPETWAMQMNAINDAPNMHELEELLISEAKYRLGKELDCPILFIYDEPLNWWAYLKRKFGKEYGRDTFAVVYSVSEEPLLQSMYRPYYQVREVSGENVK